MEQLAAPAPETPDFCGLARNRKHKADDSASRRLSRQNLSKLARIGHWGTTGEIFANVNRRFAIDRFHRQKGSIRFAKKPLTGSAIGQQEDGTGQKVARHSRERAAGPRVIFAATD